MNTHIVTQSDLEEMLGYVRPGDIAKWLRDRNIRYHFGAGKIFTTVGFIEAAGGLISDAKPDIDQERGFR